MVAIPWPLSTSPGSRPQEGAGRLINAYAVPRGEGVGPVFHRAPGAIGLGAQDASVLAWTWWSVGTEWFNPAEAAFVPSGDPVPFFRGGVLVDNLIYGAWGEKVYTLDSSGSYDEIGPLPGTDKVYFARNNASPPDVVVVCDGGPFIVTTTAVLPYPDTTVGAPNAVRFHDGYFMFTYGDGTIRASDINSTNINSLTFTTAESNPDGLLEPFSYHGYLYAMGPATIEVFGEPINTSPEFPLTRVGYHITPGLIAQHAVSGWQPEWGHPPIYCASDNTVRQIASLDETEKISPPELDELIAAVADKDTLEASVYQVSGVAFWQLSCADWSWVYNLNNQKWHERRSYLSVRSRFTNCVFAFDKWLMGDTNSGFLLEVTGAQLQEAGDPFIYEIESGPVKQFPDRARVDRADFDFVMGVGVATGTDPMQTDPKVLISYSDDGGVFWKGNYERKLGRQAKTMKRIILPPTGMTGTQGRRWRVKIADAVHAGLMGGNMDAKGVRK